MRNIFVFLILSTAACSVSTGPENHDHQTEEDAQVCQNITCGGHGTCKAGMDLDDRREWVKAPQCYCSDGFIPEHDDKLTCLAQNAETEGWGFRFDADNADAVAKELGS